MVSPLAVKLSEIQLKSVKIEEIFLFLENKGIREYFRYVDDIFLISNKETGLFYLLSWFNLRIEFKIYSRM